MWTIFTFIWCIAKKMGCKMQFNNELCIEWVRGCMMFKSSVYCAAIILSLFFVVFSKKVVHRITTTRHKTCIYCLTWPEKYLQTCTHEPKAVCVRARTEFIIMTLWFCRQWWSRADRRCRWPHPSPDQTPHPPATKGFLYIICKILRPGGGG